MTGNIYLHFLFQCQAIKPTFWAKAPKTKFFIEEKGRTENPRNIKLDKIISGENKNREKYVKENHIWKTSLRTPDCCTLDYTCVQKYVYWGGENETKERRKQRRERRKRKREKEKPEERKRVHSTTRDRPAPQSRYPQLLCCAKPGAQPQVLE